MYTLRVNYDANNQIDGYELTVNDGMGSSPVIGTYAFSDGPRNVPWGVDTVYCNGSVPWRSAELDRLPCGADAISSASMNFSMMASATETYWHCDNPQQAFQQDPTTSYNGTYDLVFMGINMNNGVRSYTGLGDVDAVSGLDGYSREHNCTKTIKAYMDTRGNGFDAYILFPSTQWSDSPAFEPSIDWMLALHKSTYSRNLWIQDGFVVGHVRTKVVQFTSPVMGGGTVAIDLDKVSIPDNMRVIYNPVPKGVK